MIHVRWEREGHAGHVVLRGEFMSVAAVFPRIQLWTWSEKSGPKYWKDEKKLVMGSPGKCLRKRKSLSSAGVVFLLSSADRTASVFGAVILQLPSQARSLAHLNETKQNKTWKHELHFYMLVFLVLFKKYNTSLYPTMCLLQTLNKRDPITQRQEILLFLTFLKKSLFGLISFVMYIITLIIPKVKYLQSKIVYCDNTLTR